MRPAPGAGSCLGESRAASAAVLGSCWRAASSDGMAEPSWTGSFFWHSPEEEEVMGEATPGSSVWRQLGGELGGQAPACAAVRAWAPWWLPCRSPCLLSGTDGSPVFDGVLQLRASGAGSHFG